MRGTLTYRLLATVALVFVTGAGLTLRAQGRPATEQARTVDNNSGEASEPDVEVLSVTGTLEKVQPDLTELLIRTLGGKEVRFIIEEDLRYRLRNKNGNNGTLPDLSKKVEVRGLYVIEDGRNKLVSLQDLAAAKKAAETPTPRAPIRQVIRYVPAPTPTPSYTQSYQVVREPPTVVYVWWYNPWRGFFYWYWWYPGGVRYVPSSAFTTSY
jgi:hypothetical protein